MSKRQRPQGDASSDTLSESGPSPQPLRRDVGPGPIDQWDLARGNSDAATPRPETTDASSGEGFLADWAAGEEWPPVEDEYIAESDPGSVAEIPPPHDQRQRGASDSRIWAWLESSRLESPDSCEMHLAQHGWTPPESQSTHKGSDADSDDANNQSRHGEADDAIKENRFHC